MGNGFPKEILVRPAQTTLIKAVESPETFTHRELGLAWRQPTFPSLLPALR